jgi:hypothetical protein
MWGELSVRPLPPTQLDLSPWQTVSLPYLDQATSLS